VSTGQQSVERDIYERWISQPLVAVGERSILNILNNFDLARSRRSAGGSII